ncbi:hypothetical protein [Chromohalobacter sp. 48-RD10]|uniref:hypothetical protein n=1 Tax=Chromohalobacter sp. 48-RD10 TaxID=2994063 RepID=UPI002468A94C|nr:hypothetical protein [Chromohalobacter sp. 48-RD10]
MASYLIAPWRWPWRRAIVCLMKRLATRWPWLLLAWGIVMLIALGSVLFTPATYRYTSVYHLATAQQRDAPMGTMVLVSPARLVGWLRAEGIPQVTRQRLMALEETQSPFTLEATHPPGSTLIVLSSKAPRQQGMSVEAWHQAAISRLATREQRLSARHKRYIERQLATQQALIKTLKTMGPGVTGATLLSAEWQRQYWQLQRDTWRDGHIKRVAERKSSPLPRQWGLAWRWGSIVALVITGVMLIFPERRRRRNGVS